MKSREKHLLSIFLLALTACSGGSSNTTANADDPLFKYQWYLKNTGQPSIGDVLPAAGVDLNIGKLHDQGITGKGVTVGVADGNPIDSSNPDLVDNLIIKTVQPDSAFPQGAVAGHATAVAGIIGAKARNGIGGRGVAPDVRILDMSVPEAEGVARPKVFNTSLGGTSPAFLPVTTFVPGGVDEVDSDLNDRNKSLNVSSVGNNFLEIQNIAGTAEPCAQATRNSGVSCLPEAANSAGYFPDALLVAAINARGVKSSYSSTGPVVWVSAPGGEYGEQRDYLLSVGDAAKISGTPDYFFSPAIVTTDRTGCNRGVKLRGENFFDNRGQASALNPLCQFTANMNGTSAAAPMVTGVAALMLQVNPKLSWREIKYILATTARRIDAGRAQVIYNGTVLDDGWVQNAAGHYYSNAYGFGLVDATQAVATARQFAPLPQLTDTNWNVYAGAPIPVSYRSAAGGATVAVNSSLKIELVQISLKTTHPTPNNLRVIVVSPSGTVSTILPGLSLVLPTPGGFQIDLTASDAFLDENSRGTWRVQVIDVLDGSAPSKYAITSAGIRVLGRPM